MENLFKVKNKDTTMTMKTLFSILLPFDSITPGSSRVSIANFVQVNII